jgi:hypothetical protein
VRKNPKPAENSGYLTRARPGIIFSPVRYRHSPRAKIVSHPMSGMYFREIRPLFNKTEEFSRITRLFTIIIIPEKLPDLANRDFFYRNYRLSLVGTVPVFILLMTGEAVEDICSIFTDIVDYSRLFRYFPDMTGNTMFHMFAGGTGMYFLKMHKEDRLQILRHSCQLFSGRI